MLNLYKLRSSEKLLTFYPWRHMINWPSSVYEASWSEMVHLRKLSGKGNLENSVKVTKI